MVVAIRVSLSEEVVQAHLSNALSSGRSSDAELEDSIRNFERLRHLAETGHLIYERIEDAHLHVWAGHSLYFRPAIH